MELEIKCSECGGKGYTYDTLKKTEFDNWWERVMDVTRDMSEDTTLKARHEEAEKLLGPGPGIHISETTISCQKCFHHGTVPTPLGLKLLKFLKDYEYVSSYHLRKDDNQSGG